LKTSPGISLVHLAHPTGVCATLAQNSVKQIMKQQYLHVVHDGEIVSILILWSHFSGYVDFQDNMYWSAENPIVVHEVVLHDTEVGMCCVVSATMITAPPSYDRKSA
jgi:hypothetical protein